MPPVMKFWLCPWMCTSYISSISSSLLSCNFYSFGPKFLNFRDGRYMDARIKHADWGFVLLLRLIHAFWLQQPLPLVFFPAKGEVVPEPLGVVLIFASWNFPICESNRFLICSDIVLLQRSLCYNSMFSTSTIICHSKVHINIMQLFFSLSHLSVVICSFVFPNYKHDSYARYTGYTVCVFPVFFKPKCLCIIFLHLQH